MTARTVRMSGSGGWVVLFGLLAGVAWAPGASAQASPSPYTYGTRYDLMGRVTGTLAPDPDGAGVLKYLAVRNTYDAAGRLTKVESGELASWFSEETAPDSWTGFAVYRIVEISYSAQNQKTLEVVKGSDAVETAATQFGYDSFGRLQCSTVRMNPAIYGSLPGACTLGAEGAFGPDRITRNVYNAAGRLTKIRRAWGTSLAQDYATFTYSGNGNRTGVTDARGYKATMEFDGVDRQSRWNLPNPGVIGTPSTTDYELYGYDANSNRTSFRKRDNSTLTYQYDALDRMTVKVVPERAGLDPSHTRDVYYGYDAFGRMTFARFDSASGEGITIGYNGFGEVTSSSTALPGLSASLSFQWDADGNRTRLTYGDGKYVTYGYDGLDRATNVLRSGSTTLVSFTYNPRGLPAGLGGGYVTTYAYHPDGRLQTLTNTPGHPSYAAQYGFGYNPAAQIIQLTRNNDAFAWTGAVNLNQGYAANGLNQYTTVAGTAFTHDGNGNLASDGASSYVYDVENRLVGASGATPATLRYDPLGRLYETAGGAAGTTRFAYDGDALVQEFGATGNLLRRYVHGTAAGDDPLVWFEGGGFTNTQQRLLRSDHQGSLVAVADATSANLIAINSYDEYGQPGNANQGRFQYTGQAWVPELGLYYYKARMYSPKLGRFLQTDPIGYEDDLNLYAYVGNDPANSTDPLGLESTGEWIDIAAEGCTPVACAGWAATQAVWTVFGAEGVSQVFDKGTGASTGNKLLAGIEVATAGIGGKVGAAYKPLEKALGREGMEAAGGASASAENIASGTRLVEQLRAEQISSQFTAAGTLTPEAIANSQMIMQAGRLGNPAIPAGFAKFTTAPLPAPFGGSVTTRFYMNPTTSEVFYGLDYKTILLP